jgi:Mor family transcriptional regulator
VARRKSTSQQRAAGRRRQELLREELAPRDAIIASRRRAGESVIALADDYNMTRQAIYDIIAREEKKAKRTRGSAA